MKCFHETVGPRTREYIKRRRASLFRKNGTCSMGSVDDVVPGRTKLHISLVTTICHIPAQYACFSVTSDVSRAMNLFAAA